MSKRDAVLWSACLVVGLSLTACGSQHVMLQAPNTVPTERFRCNEERGCEPAEVDVPTRNSYPGTEFLTLPDACGGRFHQIFIREADASEPVVEVTCAR